MITYEEALARARERKENLDNCIEYENAYVFGSAEDNNYIGGYDHTPVVVMKEDGIVTSLPENEDNIGIEIRTYDISRDIQLTYVEPADYIPKSIRKEYKLGEYAED